LSVIHKKKRLERYSQVLFCIYINWAIKTTMMMIGMIKRRRKSQTWKSPCFHAVSSRCSSSIARAFLNHGWPKKTRLYILSRLSYEDERVIETTLDGAERIEKIGHGILIIEDRTNESGE